MLRQSSRDPRWRRSRCRTRFFTSIRPTPNRTAQHLLNLLSENHARTKYFRTIAAEVHNCRFDADRAWSSIENQGNIAAQLLRYGIRGGRTQLSEAIGRRSRDTTSECFEQGESNRVPRNSDGYSVLPTCDLTRDGCCLVQNQRQWARPECLRQLVRVIRDVCRPIGKLICAGDVHNDWVLSRPPLHLIETRQRFDTRRIGPEAIDGLGRESH